MFNPMFTIQINISLMENYFNDCNNHILSDKNNLNNRPTFRASCSFFRGIDSFFFTTLFILIVHLSMFMS